MEHKLAQELRLPFNCGGCDCLLVLLLMIVVSDITTAV
jgi:hypothetical protein